jgi:hypothetical protein
LIGRACNTLLMKRLFVWRFTSSANRASVILSRAARHWRWCQALPGLGL